MARTWFAKTHLALIVSRRLVLCMTLPVCAGAETLQPALAPPASAASAGSMLQMLAGLLLVLAAIGAAAWLLKRYAANPATATGTVRVIAGAAVGPRERVVLVEIGETWLVLGVAPGQVRMLHSLPKESAGHFGDPSSTPPLTGFQGWLQRVMEKRHAC